ncbi:alpha/beta fold hydrolase [Flindersiella endophytica]
MPRIAVNGVELDYDVRGDGEPILLITGAGTRSTIWLPQIRALAAAGYQTISYDHRASSPDATPAVPYGFEDLVEDAVSLIGELELSPCHLIGYSLGAKIAQALASNHPELVRSMVLIATAPAVDTFREALLHGFAEYLRSGIKLPAGYAAALTALKMFSPHTLADDRVIGDWLELLALSAEEENGMAEQYAAATVPDQRTELAAIRAPCLVISFTDDLVTPAAAGREVAELIPDCEGAELTACGHLGLLERPQDINAIVLDFFRRNRV